MLARNATGIAAVLAAAAAAHGAAAAFNTSCSWWYLHGRVALTGDCAGPASSNRHRVVSSLDLNACIGVDTTANAIVWQPNGQAFHMLCDNCAMQRSLVDLQCDCTNILTGGKTTSSVDLNHRITVNKQGWLTC